MKDSEHRGARGAGGGASIDEQVESLLRDIEGSTPYVVHSARVPDDLDPDDAFGPLEEAGGANDSAADGGARVEAGAADAADASGTRAAAGAGAAGSREAPARGSSDASQASAPTGAATSSDAEAAAATTVAATTDDDAAASNTDADAAADDDEATVQKRRARLRTMLAAAAVLLVAIAAVTGLLIARNTLVPGTGPQQPGTMASSAAEPAEVAFEPVSDSAVPDVASWFGETPASIAEREQGSVVFDGEPERTPEDGGRLVYMVDGELLDASGDGLATVTLGLDKKKRCAYAYLLFDLDVLGTADAGFAALYTDETVARSLLEAAGVDGRAVPEGALVLTGSQKPKQEDDVESCEFEGETGREDAPTLWRLTETYDHTTGKLAGDNSVLRLMALELF